MNTYRPTEQLKVSALVHSQLRERIKAAFNLEDEDEALADTLEGETTFDQTVVAALTEAAARKSEGDGLTTIIVALQERQKRHYKACDAVRTAVIDAMQDAGETKIKHAHMTVSWRMGNSRLVIPNSDDVPPAFCQQVTKWVPDKDRIAASIEAGAGHGFAYMSNPSPILTVRIK